MGANNAVTVDLDDVLEQLETGILKVSSLRSIDHCTLQELYGEVIARIEAIKGGDSLKQLEVGLSLHRFSEDKSS